MEDTDSPASLSSLICQEDITVDDTDDNEDHDDRQQYEACKHPPYEDEYIEMLVSRECSFESRSCHESSDNVDWFRHARSESVQWILRMKAFFGFGTQTAYLAVSYFDRFSTRRTIDDGNAWALRLLSMACLSLAAKIEELRPPTLSEFQTGLYHFDSAAIQRMELLVLSTLQWRLSSVTPFAYLGHFSLKLQAHVGVVDSLFSRAIWFILAIMRVTNLVDCRPSAIATAAILAASGEVLTKKSVESKISILAFESLETEHVFFCYSVMIQESQKESLKRTKNNLVSSDVSVNSSVDVLDPSSSFKRRRLQ